MSLKVDRFKSSLHRPKTVDKFLVFIPLFSDSTIRVSSTGLPRPRRNTLTLNLCGRDVLLPSKEQTAGTWTCRVTEDADGTMNEMITRLKEYMFTEVDGVMHSYRLIEPTIYLCDEETGLVPVAKTVLHGAWLESVKEVTLDWESAAKPLQWELSFKYSIVDELTRA